MISTPHRQTAVALINEAITAGARRAKACAELEISDRTLRRWTKDGQIHADQRPLVPRPEPAAAADARDIVAAPPSPVLPQSAENPIIAAAKRAASAGAKG